jgi:hypothetical protein
MTAARPEVQCCTFAPSRKMFERTQMRLGEILDVNVIADRGSVRGRVVAPLDIDV